MQQYTIQIRKNDPTKNEPPYSAICVELNITADHFSIPEALTSLFDGVRIIEEEMNKNPQLSTEQPEYLELKPEQMLTFCVPSFV